MEYKWKLVDPEPERFAHLVTQMKVSCPWIAFSVDDKLFLNQISGVLLSCVMFLLSIDVGCLTFAPSPSLLHPVPIDRRPGGGLLRDRY